MPLLLVADEALCLMSTSMRYVLCLSLCLSLCRHATGCAGVFLGPSSLWARVSGTGMGMGPRFRLCCCCCSCWLCSGGGEALLVV